VLFQLQKPLGQTDVDPLEDDVVDKREEIGDPAGIGPEDEGPELDGSRGQIVEDRPRNSDCLDLALGDAFGRIVLVRRHAGGGQDAAFPGVDAVEKDLAPGIRDVLNPHAALQEQKHVLCPLTGFEYPGASGQVDDAAAGDKVGADGGGKRGEVGEALGPGHLMRESGRRSGRKVDRAPRRPASPLRQ
jgi:hypothetical protein